MKHRRFKKNLMFILAIVMCLSTLFSIVPMAYAAGDSETLNGWTLDEGYSVTSIWVYEGSYALQHTGAESKAVSEEFELEDGVTYYVSAFVRNANADASVKLNVGGFDIESTTNGKWEELSVNVLGDGSTDKVTITATGDAYIDGISVRPFKEGEELLTNGDFATSGWGFTWLEEFEGHKGVLKTSANAGVEAVGAPASPSVEPNSYYLYSADFYLEEGAPWLYADMNDAQGEVQIRGTKTGEWQTVSAIWSSGSNMSTPIRLVKEGNWDDPNNGVPVTGSAYIDNVSFKKVTLYEDLIDDEGFEKDPETGTTTTWTMVNNTDANIQYGNGSTPGGGGPGYHEGDETHMYGETTYTFTGTGIRWLSAKNVDCGVADVYIDGVLDKTVDLYNDSLVNATVYEKTGLENKEHTIKIVNKDEADRPYVPMDALAYETTTVSEGSGGWKLNEGASFQSGSYYLYGSKSLKLENDASATANNGATIEVEPNTYYYFSAWSLRPGNKDVEGSIVIKSADGSKDLASISGSRFNQTMWNPADGKDEAQKKTAHWEQIYGFWNSGENTEVTLCAESKGTGVIYFDDVTFNKFENRAAQGNIFANGDMEGFIPDAQDLYPTDNEKARVKADYESFLADDLANFPVSFKVGEDSYTGFGTDFTKKSQDTETVDGGTKTITVLTHKSGLEFTVESVFYPEYNAYDWTIYIANNGEENSPVISGLNAVDMTLEGEAPRLKGSQGDVAAYEPYVQSLNGTPITKTPSGGRGTNYDSSYFNFMYGDKGVLYAVGWPGQWTMTVDNSEEADKTRLTAGQEDMNTYLEPGETIRTPLMAFVHYNGRNLERATNLWRRWMIDCNMHKITEDETGEGERNLPESAIFAATSIQWHEMTRATDENQIAAIDYYLNNDIDLTFWWMDAGWYFMVDSNGEFVTVPDWGWTNTGAWVVDTNRFPSKMKAISDHAAENGIKTLLWFEPERVINKDALRTDGKTIHPDWVLNGYLVDMGRPEAVEWTLNRILEVMGDGGISMYREDFNCDPLPAWRDADKAKDASGNRSGITENLHIQGHLGMWDSILETFPNATIDSCASGGRRNDLETMRRAVPLHKTDYSYGDRTWQQAVATDMSRWIPYIGTKANGETTADNNTTTANRYSLRTAIVGAMVLGYNTEESVPIDWDIVKDITEEQKVLGEYIYSDYYVLEDWSRSESDWAAWEYYDIEKGEGYAIAFRRANAEGTKTYYLRGLEKDAEYKIWFEDQNKPVIRTGLDLMKNGVEFNLPSIESSDILHIQKADTADADRDLIADITEVSVNGQHAGAIKSADGYDRFDIRFNMALRDTVLGVGEGKVEKDVTDDYKDIITINGKKVAALLADDADAVKMDYDVVNNILNVYVKSGIMDKTADIEVMLSKNLVSDGNGKIEGKTIFTYSAANDEWTKQTVVEHVPVESVTVSGNKVMYIDATQKLTATIIPVDADNKNVTWSSEDDKIATVDAEGNVTAVAEGKVKIYATAADGSGASDYIEITVVQVPAIPVESITVAGKDEMKVGESQKLTATVLPDNADNKGVMWETEDPVIALVDEDGTVTAVSEGTVKIYATAADGSNVYGYIEINVAADGEPVKPGEPTDEPSDKPTEPSDKPTDPDAPKTGDEANILLWIVLGLMGAAGAAAVVVFVRKRRHN